MTGCLSPRGGCLPRRFMMLGGHLVSLVICSVLTIFLLHTCIFIISVNVTVFIKSGHLFSFHVCFSGCLAGCCACASPGEILYILPKLATMSVLCSWHVHCLGQVIWWSDRNRQGLLTESIYVSFVNK